MRFPRTITRLVVWMMPELRLARTEFERNEAMYRAGVMAPIGILFVMVFPAALGVIEFVFSPPPFPASLSMWVEILIRFARGCIWILPLVIVVLSWKQIQRRRRDARLFLRSRGVPLCLVCGYDLNGIDASITPRCPECGETISITPATSHPTPSQSMNTPGKHS